MSTSMPFSLDICTFSGETSSSVEMPPVGRIKPENATYLNQNSSISTSIITHKDNNNSDNYKVKVVYIYRPTIAKNTNGSDIADVSYFHEEGKDLLFGLAALFCFMLIPLFLGCADCISTLMKTDNGDMESSISDPESEQHVQEMPEVLDGRIQRHIDSLRQQLSSLPMPNNVNEEFQQQTLQEEIEPVIGVNLREEMFVPPVFEREQYLMRAPSTIHFESEDEGPIFTLPSKPRPEIPPPLSLTNSDVPQLEVLSDISNPDQDSSGNFTSHCKYNSLYCKQLQDVLVNETALDS